MIVKRLLTTGSRYWDNYGTIARAMGVAISELVDVNKTTLKQGEVKQKIIVVHGACPPKKVYDEDGNWTYVGADYFVDEFANKIRSSMLSRGVQIEIERHKANWNKHGIAAGPIRNKEMVDLGVDQALIFNKNNSAGTASCKKFIIAAGVPYKEYSS